MAFPNKSYFWLWKYSDNIYGIVVFDNEPLEAGVTHLSNTGLEWLIVKHHNNICSQFYHACWI